MANTLNLINGFLKSGTLQTYTQLQVTLGAAGSACQTALALVGVAVVKRIGGTFSWAFA
jgi:hypothetical protein